MQISMPLHLNSIAKQFDRSDFFRSVVITSMLFAVLLFTSEVYASTVTLSVNVLTSLTFTSLTNNFTNVTPGTAAMATTTILVTTNDVNGWNVTLSGDNKNTGNNNLQLTGTPATQITDQTEWVPGTATSSAGNAARISALANSGNVLAFRVMSASSTNGSVFYSTSWWGSADNYSTDNANTLFSGIASATVQRQIGNAGTVTYSTSAHINTVQYYLNVASTQQTGAYTAPITYTATGN